ncbi:MAG TPA: MopE-related protein [Kofleriaceae bacterium]|nr:MopE-related protein [Kofleriaceae bacterium]
MRILPRRLAAPFVLALSCLSPLLLTSDAHAGEALKPYVVFILDSSGSMNGATNAGPTSCGTADTKLNHAKCAINKISNSYGDMVLALGRFRHTQAGTFATDCNTDCSVTASTCTTDDRSLEMLAGLVDGANTQPALYTDGVCNSCAATGAGQVEIVKMGGCTPLGGSLVGAKRYWQGLQRSDATILWPSGSPGFSPISNDPTKDVFLTPTQQCRPYITILLTDGAETVSGADAPGAAASMLSTSVGGKNYRITTKPIGFGIAPGNAAVEAIAHSGGAPDAPGVNEGSYAANEEELQLAVSKIIADSVRSEVCNNLDDDCDTRIDEDFPSKGGTCDNGLLGVCRGTGAYVCRPDGTGTQCNITNPGGTPSVEICNNLDDDCNGLVDEGVCGTCGDVEICNNIDDDCDNLVDEDLTRQCGSNVGECRVGIETCAAGAWGACTGVNPTTETCDGRDNDCDGTRDGIAEACSALPGGNPNMGICRPGTHTCPSGGSGVFGACLGEVVPRVEACNLLDDDCDGLTDESTGGARCSTTCGVGTTVCTNGVLMCNAQPATTDDTCDGNDDDCDGNIDENAMDMGACDAGGTICGGVLTCTGGRYVCSGGTAIRQESCDCDDNDCDNKVDEDPNCPGGSTCTNCQCAFACGAGEFPCPSGKICKDNFCVNDPCFNKVCDPTPNGEKTVCLEGTCVLACSQITCNANEVCDATSGTCLPNNCITFPDKCTAAQNCVGGTCVDDPCAGVTCPGDQFCSAGTCVGSCAGVQCPTGNYCSRGACVATMCPDGCPKDTYCNETNGRCDTSMCPVGSSCGQAQVCDPRTGECVTDPCLGITCPAAGQLCREGSCYDPNNLPPDGTKQQFVTPGGGGGCSTSNDNSGALVMLFGLLGAIGLPRRKRNDRGQGGAA